MTPELYRTSLESSGEPSRSALFLLNALTFFDPGKRPTVKLSPLKPESPAISVQRLGHGLTIVPAADSSQEEKPRQWNRWLHQKHLDGAFILLAVGAVVLLLLISR